MGDAGEGLIDADSRIQERMEELERQRKRPARTRSGTLRKCTAMESLRLARVELQRQLESTAHERRRAQLTQAIADIDRRMADLQARLG